MERSLTTSEDFLLAARAVGRMVLGSAPQAAVRRAQEELEAAEAAAPGVSRTAYLREAFSLTRGETLLLEACAELLFARGELPERPRALAILAENGFVGVPSVLFSEGLHPLAVDWLLEREPREMPGLTFDWCADAPLYHSQKVLSEMDAFVRALAEGAVPLPAAIVLQGEKGSGRRFLFSRLAAQQGCPLVCLDGTQPAAAQDVQVAAQLYGALVCVADDAAARESARALAARLPLLLYAAGADMPEIGAACVLQRAVEPMSAGARARALEDWCGVQGDAWERALELFRPGVGRLRQAAARLTAERAVQESPAPAQLTAIFRESSAAALRESAQRLATTMCMEDLVLPPAAMEQLVALRDFARVQDRVLHGWGFAEKAPYGRGLTALFYGASGTGKTMAASVLANELGMELYRVDLSRLISKYVGETQKNLGRVFDQARDCGCILFFDEADALFARRSEASDAQDKYSNAEVAYLLQRTEQYDGILLMATNLLQNFDEAFRRRIGFMIHFPLPDDARRKAMWERIFPAAAPVGKLDLELLASQLELSGAGIRNTALGAARLAAAQGGAITMDRIVQAARGEYQKQGKPFPQKLDMMFTRERSETL